MPPPTPSSARLEAEAKATQADIAYTLSELKRTLLGGTRDAAHKAVEAGARHPVLTLATATLAGFVAATVMVPSKKDALLKQFASLEAALNNKPDPHAKPKSSLKGALLKSAFKFAKPTLVNLATALLARRAHPSAIPPDEPAS